METLTVEFKIGFDSYTKMERGDEPLMREDAYDLLDSLFKEVYAMSLNEHYQQQKALEEF